MTNKTFYQAAANEVASGHLDAALWIKVCAEMPEAETKTQQAKYIALRANEMATLVTTHNARNWVSYLFFYWVLYFVVLFVVAFTVASILDDRTGSLLPLSVFVAICVGGVIVRYILGRCVKPLSKSHRG